jgi:hypothetical protein
MILKNFTIDLIHYGKDLFTSSKFQPIKNQPWKNKPRGGFWASPVDCDRSWKEFISDIRMNDSDDEYFQRNFVFAYTGTFLIIRGALDLGNLPWRQPYNKTKGCKIPAGTGLVLDFEQLKANGIDAILYYETGEAYDWMYKYNKDLYGWDCTSVLILNPNPIYNNDCVE